MKIVILFLILSFFSSKIKDQIKIEIEIEIGISYPNAIALSLAMAMPEKALLDFLYLSSAKSHLFGIRPELELPKTFSRKKTHQMIEQIPSLQRRTMVKLALRSA